MAKVVRRVKQQVKHKGTKWSTALIQMMRSMQLEGLDFVETIDPARLVPWSSPTFNAITIEHDKMQALEDAAETMQTSDRVIFTDASVNDSGAGVAVVMLDHNHGRQRTA